MDRGDMDDDDDLNIGRQFGGGGCATSNWSPTTTGSDGGDKGPPE